MPALAPDLATRLVAPYPDVADYLGTRSGLPGPRGNLELLAATADRLPQGQAGRLRGEAASTCAAAA